MFLVAGASSLTGRQVVMKLLRESRPVRVLVRKDSDAEHFAALGADVVKGDIRDQDALRRACHQVEVVISLVGRHFAATEAGFREVDLQGNENLARAAYENQAKHYILISALWADHDPGPIIFGVKREAEEAVIQSGLSYTILRPCTFAEGANSLIGIVGPTIERWGLALIPSPDSKPVSFITITDLADAIVQLASNPTPYKNQILELGGPQSLTLGAGATRIAELLGRKLRVVRLPRSVLSMLRTIAKVLGFGPYEAVLFLEMLRDHGFFCDATPLRELLGHEPQSIDEVLKEYYRQNKRTPWRDSIYGTLLMRSK